MSRMKDPGVLNGKFPLIPSAYGTGNPVVDEVDKFTLYKPKLTKKNIIHVKIILSKYVHVFICISILEDN